MNKKGKHGGEKINVVVYGQTLKGSLMMLFTNNRSHSTPTFPSINFTGFMNTFGKQSKEHIHRLMRVKCWLKGDVSKCSVSRLFANS